MDKSIICRIQDLIHQYSQEGTYLWVEIYEDFLKYSITTFYIESSGITIHRSYTKNIPFATINEMSDDDIIESISHFVEETKKQIKKEEK